MAECIFPDGCPFNDSGSKDCGINLANPEVCFFAPVEPPGRPHLYYVPDGTVGKEPGYYIWNKKLSELLGPFYHQADAERAFSDS